MPVGRPRIISSPDEMQILGEEFFRQCKESEEPITITGLALALGLSSRESLNEYGKRVEFSDTVKRLKMVCENFAEKRLFGNNPTGAIFALKNYEWTDKQQQEISGLDGRPIPVSINLDI